MKELKGFRASHKNRWLLIKNKILSPQEFMLYEFYLDICGFDPRNKYYGLFEYYKDEVANIFNKSEETIHSWHKGLKQKRFIATHDKKRHQYRIKHPSRYEVNNLHHGEAFTAVKLESILTFEEILQESYVFSKNKQVKIPKSLSISGSDSHTTAVRSYKGSVTDLSDKELENDIEDIFGEEL